MAATQTQNPQTAPRPGRPGQAPAGRASAGRASAGRASAGRASAGRASAGRASAGSVPAGSVLAGRAPADQRPDLAGALRPLVIDVGIPLGTYYLLRDGFGVSLWLSLALSSICP